MLIIEQTEEITKNYIILTEMKSKIAFLEEEIFSLKKEHGNIINIEKEDFKQNFEAKEDTEEHCKKISQELVVSTN